MGCSRIHGLRPSFNSKSSLANTHTTTQPYQPHHQTQRLKSRFRLQSPHNPLLSFNRNPSFYPAWSSPSSFSAWTQAGLLRAHHLFSHGSFKPFPVFCVKPMAYHSLKSFATWKSCTSLPPTHHPTLLSSTSPHLNRSEKQTHIVVVQSQTSMPYFYHTPHPPYQPTQANGKTTLTKP